MGIAAVSHGDCSCKPWGLQQRGRTRVRVQLQQGILRRGCSCKPWLTCNRWKNVSSGLEEHLHVLAYSCSRDSPQGLQLYKQWVTSRAPSRPRRAGTFGGSLRVLPEGNDSVVW